MHMLRPSRTPLLFWALTASMRPRKWELRPCLDLRPCTLEDTAQCTWGRRQKMRGRKTRGMDAVSGFSERCSSDCGFDILASASSQLETWPRGTRSPSALRTAADLHSFMKSERATVENTFAAATLILFTLSPNPSTLPHDESCRARVYSCFCRLCLPVGTLPVLRGCKG
jgi:hypothetical protein